MSKNLYQPSGAILYHVKMGIPGKVIKDANLTHVASHFTTATRTQACQNFYKLLYKTLFFSEYDTINNTDEDLKLVFETFLKSCVSLFEELLLKLEELAMKRFWLYKQFIEDNEIESFLDPRLKTFKLTNITDQYSDLEEANVAFNVNFRGKLFKAIDSIYEDTHVNKLIKSKVEETIQWMFDEKNPYKKTQTITNKFLTSSVSFEGEEVLASSNPGNNISPHVHAYPDFTFLDWLPPLMNSIDAFRAAKEKDRKELELQLEAQIFLDELENGVSEGGRELSELSEAAQAIKEDTLIQEARSAPSRFVNPYKQSIGNPCIEAYLPAKLRYNKQKTEDIRGIVSPPILDVDFMFFNDQQTDLFAESEGMVVESTPFHIENNPELAVDMYWTQKHAADAIVKHEQDMLAAETKKREAARDLAKKLSNSQPKTGRAHYHPYNKRNKT